MGEKAKQTKKTAPKVPFVVSMSLAGSACCEFSRLP